MSDTMRDRAQEHVSRMTEHGLPTGPLTDTNGWLAEALTAFAKAELERAAAPDMREALERALTRTERLASESRGPIALDLKFIAKDIRAALSKADGEEK